MGHQYITLKIKMPIFKMPTIIFLECSRMIAGSAFLQSHFHLAQSNASSVVALIIFISSVSWSSHRFLVFLLVAALVD